MDVHFSFIGIMLGLVTLLLVAVMIAYAIKSRRKAWLQDGRRRDQRRGDF